MPKGIYDRRVTRPHKASMADISTTSADWTAGTSQTFTVTLTRDQVINLIQLMTTNQPTKG